jgi:hypothetical protein
MDKILRAGDSGEQVKVLQSLLRRSGFFEGAVLGNFKTLTTKAVREFQQTHQGPDGKWLAVDGIVGPGTWWALQNPTGDAQRSFLKTDNSVIPAGISEDRKKLLEVCIKEHKAGVAETPKGSNWGDGVTKYLTGVGPCAWCCFFVSWAFKEALGKYPLGKRHGHCLTFWNEAKAAGKGFLKSKYEPIPGDIFIMLYRSSSGNLTGSGHTGFVSNVFVRRINTFEGNAGDRLKHGLRELDAGTLVGFINLFGDSNHDFKHQIISSEKLESSYSSTR